MRRLAEAYRALYSPKGASYDDLYDALRETVSELLATARCPSGRSWRWHRDIVVSNSRAWVPPMATSTSDPRSCSRSSARSWNAGRNRPTRSPGVRSPTSCEMNRSNHGPSGPTVPYCGTFFAAWSMCGAQRHPPDPGRESQRDYDSASHAGSPLDRIGVSLGGRRYCTGVNSPCPAACRWEAGSTSTWTSAAASPVSRAPCTAPCSTAGSGSIPRVHLFSERVVDVSLAQLRQGVCSTTVGTSIACVADHLRRHQVKRAVVLTDGYVGRPTGGDRETLCRVKLGVALTPGNSTRADLEEVTDYWAQLDEPRSK